jgi:hypothetical protein
MEKIPTFAKYVGDAEGAHTVIHCCHKYKTINISEEFDIFCIYL